jgi:hypothetical protein
MASATGPTLLAAPADRVHDPAHTFLNRLVLPNADHYPSG